MWKFLFCNLFILTINNEIVEEIYIYSPFLHQGLHQKANKCLSNFIPIHKIPIILNEEDIDLLNDEIVNNKDFQ